MASRAISPPDGRHPQGGSAHLSHFSIETRGTSSAAKCFALVGIQTMRKTHLHLQQPIDFAQDAVDVERFVDEGIDATGCGKLAMPFLWIAGHHDDPRPPAGTPSNVVENREAAPFGHDHVEND